MTAPHPDPASGAPSAGRRIPIDDIWRATEQLLRGSESAAVVAIGGNGLFQPMPSGIPLFGHPVIEGHASALELVTPSEMTAVIDTWKQTLIDGAGRVEVESLSSGGRMSLHFMDVRDRYQVILGIVVHHDRHTGLSSQRGRDDVLSPRFSRVTKNQLSEFIEIDEAFELMLGHSRVDLIGRRHLDLIHPDDQSAAIANWMDLLAAPGRSRRVRLRHADGRWIWFEVTNDNRLNGPHDPAIVAELVDVSDEMAAYEAVRVREQQLVRLTETLPVGVLQIDPSGQVVHRNGRISVLLDPRPGAGLDDILAGVGGADASVLTGLIDDALVRGTDSDVELPVRRSDGATIRCRISLRALVEDDGRAGGALICIDDVTESALLREQLHEQATLDALTGCHNRASILAVTEHALAEAAGLGTGVAVVFIDLDGFRQVNDRQGHAAGDRLLVDIAGCLRQTTRTRDAVGRIGGDEFLVVGRQVASAAQADELGERLAAALRLLASPGGGTIGQHRRGLVGACGRVERHGRRAGRHGGRAGRGARGVR